MPAVILWLKQAWAWIRRWGGWIAGPVIALVLVLLGRRRTVVSADPTFQKKVESDTAKAEAAAVQQAALDKFREAQAQEAHEAALLRQQAIEVTILEKKPEEVNEFVKEAGEAARGEKKP